MAKDNLKVIGFGTDASHRDLTADDRILATALEKRGVQVVPVVWSEAEPQSLSCDLLLVRSVWDYHLRPQDFMRWIDGMSGRIPVVNPPEMIRWNMDKRYLREIASAGFDVPRTIFLDQSADVDLAEVMARGGLEQAVVKPVVSASAYETRRIDNPRSEDNVWLNRMLQRRPMMVQEFIPEIQSAGEWSLIFAGMKFTHAVRKAPKPGDFRVQEEHGGLHTLASPPPEALTMARKIMERFAPDAAYSRVDIVMRNDQPTLMELELIEPLLHFEMSPQAAEVLADRLAKAYR
jgi:glutathione synthase/RimK-type ligase-like ATP-grasp enzyme